MKPTTKRLCEELARQHDVDPSRVRMVFSPYRVCPLGAHIDHQLGKVSAMALDRGVWLAYIPWTVPEVQMRSLDLPGKVHFQLDDVPGKQNGDWGNYLRGAVLALQQNHELETGLTGIVQGSLPEGGLSSSAAVGVSYLLALEDVNGLNVGPMQNIRMDQYIENTYLGLRNGILDQAAILLSRRRHLTLLDCANMGCEWIQQPNHMPDFTIMIAFSGIRKPLTGTDYNRRVAECIEAASVLLNAAGKTETEPLLRNVSAEQLDAFGDRLSKPLARRAAHFFSEMDRVHHGVHAWRQGDLSEFGRLITASGASSIHNYECGAPPLIDLYRLLIKTDGVYGARFSGAGFRGCCLAIVEPKRADEIADRVLGQYQRQYPELAREARMVQCKPGDGAAVFAHDGLS